MPSKYMTQFATPQDVAEGAADQALEKLSNLTSGNSPVHVALTGGTVGILTLAKWAEHPKRDLVDYSKVHFWWGDERFVDQDSSDRNFIQAWDALLCNLEIPFENLHEFPSASDGLTLDEARSAFEQEFSKWQPVFEFALMGMGPDGHVASLFPGHEALESQGFVIAEPNSPKPPAERLSLSYAALNSAKEIWFLIAGSDKAEALAVAHSDTPARLPVGRLWGSVANRWFIDNAAGSLLTNS